MSPIPSSNSQIKAEVVLSLWTGKQITASLEKSFDKLAQIHKLIPSNENNGDKQLNKLKKNGFVQLLNINLEEDFSSSEEKEPSKINKVISKMSFRK